jgi:hypothetical protein
MKLTYFQTGNPFSVTVFPFDDMYITDAKFIKIAIKDDLWLGVLTGDYTKYIGNISLNVVTSLTDFIGIQTQMQITKAEIVNVVYSYDQQIKILRDKEAGRNLEQFTEFDTFVQSIP